MLMDKAMKLAFAEADKNGAQPIAFPVDNVQGELPEFNPKMSLADMKSYYIVTQDRYDELMQKAYGNE